MMISVGGGAGLGPTTIGGGEPGGGGPGGRPIAVGAARDMSVVLSSDQQSLIITLTPNDNALYATGANYSVFWLDPILFSQSDIYGQTQANITGNGLSVVQGRKKVVDVAGGDGIVTATVPYLPYVTGGWMYAVAIPVGNTKEYRLSGTNFVAVPVLGPSGEPLSAEAPSNLNVSFTSLTGTNRLVHFTWRNAATQATVKYIKITAVNYWNDSMQRDVAIFNVTTQPGVQQGFTPLNFSIADNSQSVILEADNSIGAHAITWYFVPMSSALTPLHLSACPNYGTGAIT